RTALRRGRDPEDAAACGDDVDLAGRVLAEAGDLAAGIELRPVSFVDCAPAVDPQALHEAGAEVAVEVMPAQRRDSVTSVDVAAGYRAGAAVVTVLGDGKI